MRYQKIYSQIWNDEKFTRLTPSQQRLFLYILTCPHGNIIGFFVLKKGYVCDDLKSLPKDFEKDLRKLIESGLIEYDFDTSIVLIKKFLKHNPLTNPNQIKAAKNLLKELPNTKLFHRFIEVLPEVLKEELNEVLKEVLPKPDTDTDTDTEERENIYICARARATPSPKMKFLDSVFLTDEEYKKLQEVIGQKSLEVGIEKLDYSITVKGGKYKDHYKTLLNWWKRGYLNNNGGQSTSGGIRPEEPDMIDRILKGEL